MSTPNEEFAIACLKLAGESAGLPLVTASGRPSWDDIELLRARGGGGEIAMLDLAVDAWRCSQGSITWAFARNDPTTALAVLDALNEAYTKVLS